MKNAIGFKVLPNGNVVIAIKDTSGLTEKFLIQELKQVQGVKSEVVFEETFYCQTAALAFVADHQTKEV